MSDNILNKKIEIKNEKQLKLLILIIIVRHISTYLFDLSMYTPNAFWDWVVTCTVYILITLPCFIAYKKVGMYKEQIDFKNKKQYVYGVLLVLPLILCASISSGKSLYEMFTSSDEIYVIRGSSNFLWLFIFYMFVVGLTEEFCYRVYIQGELKTLLNKFTFLAPAIAALCFGYMHIVQGSMEQVKFTIMFGFVLGYARYFIKDCTFISLVIAHGLYDFIAVYYCW